MRISDWSSDVCSSDLREVDAAEVLAHVHQHLRLVLELLDLLVDALERARGGQDVLRIVAGVEHDAAELCMGRRRGHRDHAHAERGAGDKAEGGRDQVLSSRDTHYLSPSWGAWGSGEIGRAHV